MPTIELFGASGCAYTREMREWLEWRGVAFVEYDVEREHDARARMAEVSPGTRAVPVLVEDGKVVQVGWQGRGCTIA